MTQSAERPCGNSEHSELIRVLALMFTERVSGPARQLFQLIRLFDRRRFHVSIASTVVEGRSSEFLDEINAKGVPFEALSQRSILDPGPIQEVVDLVKNKKITIIQSHGYKSAFIAFWARLFLGVPWIAFLHGHTTENFKVRMYHALEFYLVRQADRIITVSYEMRNRLVSRGLPAEKTLVVQNAIGPDQFVCSSAEDLRKKFGVASDEMLIGVIGRFSSEKGVDVFLEAFKRLLESGQQAKAMLIGEGLLENELREYCRLHHIDEKVVFTGYQPAIAAFYPILDLMVMPSRSEGLPNVALEALYFGVPVVATDVGGTAEVVVDGKTGLLVPTEQPELMQAAMARVLNDKPLRDQLIEQGKEYIAANFSPQARIAKMEHLYQELAASTGRKSGSKP